MQGDIVRICDVNGTTVTEYTYDAWGKVISVTGSLANTVGKVNPFRYRGYYYDAETGFYYLQTRYYDPEVGRFISPDTSNVLTATLGALTDKNLFAYCDNNPVMRADHGGHFWHLVVGGLIGAVIGGVSAAVSGGDVVDVLIGIVAGAAGGVLATSSAGVLTQAVGSAAISMASNGCPANKSYYFFGR